MHTPLKHIFIATLSLALPNIAIADDIAGIVVDHNDNPVANAEVAKTWTFNDGQINAYKSTTTDDKGAFSLKVDLYNRPTVIMAMSEDRSIGGLILIDPEVLRTGLYKITLNPLVEIKGDFDSTGLGARPTWTNVYMSLMPGRVRVAGNMSTNADFSFKLPPGEYQFWAYGTDVRNHTRNLTLSEDQPPLDMGTIDLEPTIIAQHYGKAPPAWNVTDARGTSKEVTLEDYKGTWVLIEFWGYW